MAFSLLFVVPSLAEKVYHTRRTKARKNPLSGTKNPVGTAFLRFSSHKNKKATLSRGRTKGISALADDLLGVAEDHVVNILLDEVLKHIRFHAPFLHLLQFVL